MRLRGYKGPDKIQDSVSLTHSEPGSLYVLKHTRLLPSQEPQAGETCDTDPKEASRCYGLIPSHLTELAPENI